MQTIGRIYLGELAEMQRRGITPEEAVQAILAEASKRHPKAVGLHIVKVPMHEGFDIIAL